MNAARFVLLFALLAVGLAPMAQAGSQSSQRAKDLNTAQLIEAARVRGEITAETAQLYLAYALAAPEKLPEEYHSPVPWDGTLPLLRLQTASRAMEAGPARAEIEALLAGTCDESTTFLPNIRDTAYFHIQYGSIGGQDLTIDDYANSLDAAWATEVVSFGWAAPPVLPSNPPPGDRYHVRIDALDGGLYGYVYFEGTHAGPVGDNPNTAWNDQDAFASCMVLNRDYSAFGGTELQAMQATVAHEFNHSIQFGYGAITGPNAPDLSFAEASSTWMEDEVFDAANDNYYYLWPSFATCMGEYNPAYPHSVYDYWITLRGITEPYGCGTAGAGEQIMQDFWVGTSQSATSNMLSALSAALTNKGTTLANAYHAYAIAVLFNKTCAGGYVSPYCFEEGSAYVASAGPTVVPYTIASVGGSYPGSLADNYSLNWINLPTGSVPYRVTLRNSDSGGQLRGSVVCDTGAALVVTPFPQVAGGDSSTMLAGYNPSGCNSVVAVVTNQTQTADNPASCTARTYLIQTSREFVVDHSLFVPLVSGAEVTIPGGEIVNGDFEQGAVAWQQSSTNGWPLIVHAADPGLPAHSGIWLAWLGGDDLERSVLQQQVTVPGGTPSLVYWDWI
ncbi:MAG TPA: hypothetical protein VLC52_01325, partial [Anaerolineae bacterium]|nr:hypothetical protein [Anaerolineae bacterium]